MIASSIGVNQVVCAEFTHQRPTIKGHNPLKAKNFQIEDSPVI